MYHSLCRSDRVCCGEMQGGMVADLIRLFLIDFTPLDHVTFVLTCVQLKQRSSDVWMCVIQVTHALLKVHRSILTQEE